jgi:two-component system NtrC family sensor kinase
MDNIHRDALTTAIIEGALDAIITIDEAGQVIDFNPSARRMFQYSPEEVVAKPIAELIIPERLRHQHHDGMARYLATGERKIIGEHIETTGMRSDGTEFPVELTLAEVKVEGRRLFTASLRDLSESVAAQAAIERQREALWQSEKLSALGSLISSVAHELNNPLSVLMGQAEMLAEDAHDERIARRGRRIHAAAKRCTRIVRSFLGMARKQAPQREIFSLGESVQTALEVLEYSLRTSGITVDVDIPEGIPVVYGDPDQLAQVLLNVLVNSHHALLEISDDRRIVIRAGGDDSSVRLTITDSGPGISADVEERIFEPFFTTKEEGIGTGIGLSLARSLVEAHGGNLELAESDAGASFELSLPVHRAPPERAADQAAIPVLTGVRTVLVIDDELEVVELLEDILTLDGHRVSTATRRAEALALLEEGSFDAIICDLRLPDLDGSWLFEWLKQHKPMLAERIGFLTGDTMSPAAIRFLQHAGRPVCEKPFRPSEILVLLEKLCPEPDAG